MSSTYGDPTQFEISSITIDGQDVVGLFSSISIYEDIYRPCVTGQIVIRDSEGAGFIEEQQIEFIEPIEFEFKSGDGESLKFKGFLNGLRNEIVNGSNKLYTVDFTSESVRKNEITYITKSFKESSPEDIVQEMVKKLGGKLESEGRGEKLNYIAPNRRPVDIIKYVLTHGLTGDSSATQSDDQKEEEAKGTTGFMCWETIDGFRFATVKDVSQGKAGEDHTEFSTQLANRSQTLEESMKNIVDIEFTQIGDFQTKLRSGAFGSRNISFDMDTGEYKQFDYYNSEEMTEKQKKYFPEGTISRIFNRSIDNQKFSNECQKAPPDEGDQSRRYLSQDPGMQNCFSDQTGQITLYPQFKMRAGDSIDITLNKVKDEGKADGQEDKKHSGKYVCQQVAHHLFIDGRAYTRVKTVRSTLQQDEASSGQ